MKPIGLIVVFMTLCLVAALVYEPKGIVVHAGTASLIEILRADGGIPAQKASKRLISTREATIKDIMAIAKQKSTGKSFSSKELAIGLLGEYRAVQAISLLLDEIEYRPPAYTSPKTSAFSASHRLIR